MTSLLVVIIPHTLKLALFLFVLFSWGGTEQGAPLVLQKVDSLNMIQPGDWGWRRRTKGSDTASEKGSQGGLDLDCVCVRCCAVSCVVPETRSLLLRELCRVIRVLPKNTGSGISDGRKWQDRAG